MQSFKSIANEAMARYTAGIITHMLEDPAVNVFRVIYNHQNELQQLKKETFQHIWCRQEEDGTIALLPLDDVFPALQSRISSLESKINANTLIAEKLEKAFAELQIEPPLSALDGQSRKIHAEIDRVNQDLNRSLFPYLQAAERLHANAEKAPEVIQLRKEAASKIALLEAEAKEIDEKLTKIRVILAGVRT